MLDPNAYEILGAGGLALLFGGLAVRHVVRERAEWRRRRELDAALRGALDRELKLAGESPYERWRRKVGELDPVTRRTIAADLVKEIRRRERAADRKH